MSFPQVSAEQKAHCHKVMAYIRDVLIKKDGWIGFDEYMRHALYAPGLGYYASGSIKFGQAGDFITAPETGDLFGRCLASQVSESLAALGGGSILEFGAGSGALAATMLNALELEQALPQTYYILELSANLRQQQHDTIKALAGEHLTRVVWLQALPCNFDGVVVANELIDAIPVKVFEQEPSGQVTELGVAMKDTQLEEFVWQKRLAPKKLAKAVETLNIKCNTGSYRSEINFQAHAWVASLADFINRGVVLLIDYGFAQNEYYHPDRHQGTLMCHFQHHAFEDPFYLPGLQDITAHVDFTAIARSANDAGFDVIGYATQGAFLLSSGLLNQIAPDASVQIQLELSQQVKKLTMPHEMGELFKVLALSKAVMPSLSGFAQQNKAHRLTTNQ